MYTIKLLVVINVSKFSNFRDEPRLGEQALVQKRGQVSDGGIGKIFAAWGDPPGKKPCVVPK